MTGLPGDDKALFERMVNDAMRVFGYGRPKAEKLVKGVIPRIRLQAQIQKERKKAARKKKFNGSQKRGGPMTREEVAKLPPVVPPRPPPRNAKGRMERPLGPDEGERRRPGRLSGNRR